MPVIDIDGEKKKVACGPCIRGHRSSKCQHSDRVLIEVRKPGRPLSACPHPTGSCGCQRAVFYTVPKNETTTPSGPLTPTSGAFSPLTQQASNRVQKSKPRKNSTSVNTNHIQRAFDSDPTVLAQQASHKQDIGLPQESSESSSSNVPSLVSSSSSTPQTEAIDTNQRVGTNLPPLPESESQPSRQLQLGMLGVGGYGTVSDDLGWGGEWPDYNSIPPPADRITDAPVKSSCCSGGSSTSATKPEPIPEPVQVKSSCCAGKASQSAPEPNPAIPQYSATTQTSHIPIAQHLDLSFSNQFSFAAPNFQHPPANGMMFAEDQFGCLHEPEHACACGEGCECLGCSMHPANRTTTDYVRYHTELAMRDWPGQPHFQMPPPSNYGQHFANFGPVQGAIGFGGLNGALTSSHSPYMSAVPLMAQPQFAPQWSMNQQPLTTPTYEMSQFTLQQSTPMATPPTQAGQLRPRSSPQASTEQQKHHVQTHARQLSAHETKGYDHESPSTEDDASTLSPSAFSVQQYNIPGCNDMTGSCLCGDGCQCEGCLTHNGHENATIDSDVEAQKDGLPSIDESVGHTFAHSAFDDALQDSVFPLAGTG